MMCPCGRMIGIDRDCDPPAFYDQNKLEAPVTHCPACNALLTLDMLVHSGIVQPNPMVEVLRILARRGRLIREQEERELAARKESSVSPSEVPLERSGDDAPNQPTKATTIPPLDLSSFRFLVAALPNSKLFFTVSGAHLYGFPSPDSDVDLRGVFVLPQRALLGLDAPEETFSHTMRYGGYEVDLVTHEVKKFLDLLLRKNGYVLEQLYSPLVVWGGAAFEELRDLARGAITRHVYHHYAGFARNKLREFEGESPRRVKTLLYVYRVLLTGIHLLRTGEVEANLLHLYPAFDLPFIPDLIAQKAAEQAALDETTLPHYQQAIERLQAELDEAFATTTLPEAPTNRPALDDFLLRLRLGDKRG